MGSCVGIVIGIRLTDSDVELDLDGD